ncbi:unnamed protein product [Larinioides sclopetarius]|uniref:Transposase n=1 Tax=Larinioides sclopetarius TaxID=280406 RepID=A0AAV1YV36_9ARAC
MRQLVILSHLFSTFSTLGRQNMFNEKSSPLQDFVIPALDPETYEEFLHFGPGLILFISEKIFCTERDSWVIILVPFLESNPNPDLCYPSPRRNVRRVPPWGFRAGSVHANRFFLQRGRFQSFYSNDVRKYVRRRVGEALHPDCIEATTKNPTTVMIWAYMSVDGVGRIQKIDGILNAKKYIETVLEPKLIPSIRDLFPNNAPFIFQQDSAPCHTAKEESTENGVLVDDPVLLGAEGASTPQFSRRTLNRKRKHAELLVAAAGLKAMAVRLPGLSCADEFDHLGGLIAMVLKKQRPDLVLEAQIEIMSVCSKYQHLNLRAPLVDITAETISVEDPPVERDPLSWAM